MAERETASSITTEIERFGKELDKSEQNGGEIPKDVSFGSSKFHKNVHHICNSS